MRHIHLHYQIQALHFIVYKVYLITPNMSRLPENFKKEAVGQTCLITKPKQAYPTDLNDTDWEIAIQYLPPEATIGRQREYGWHVILNEIFYILPTGGSWRRSLICCEPSALTGG